MKKNKKQYKKQYKEQYKKQYSIFSVIYTAASIVLFILSICCFFYLWSACKRQEKEEEIAEVYIEELLDLSDKLESQDETVEAEKQLTYREAIEQGLISTTVWDKENENFYETEYTDEEGVYHVDRVITFDYYDTAYYKGADNITYVPSYAEGELAFVLEYPKCGLRRGVYVAPTSVQTDHNLNMWMTVLVNPAMELGLTSITIKGHNHTSQNLSWNQVKNATIGDRFTIYAESGVYIYEVTDIFVMPRSVVEESLDNDLLGYSSDTCFLVTCGRANFPASHFKYLRQGTSYTGPHSLSEYYTAELTSSRYQDFVVEGHIVEKYSLTEYGQKVIEDEEGWREN